MCCGVCGDGNILPGGIPCPIRGGGAIDCINGFIGFIVFIVICRVVRKAVGMGAAMWTSAWVGGASAKSW